VTIQIESFGPFVFFEVISILQISLLFLDGQRLQSGVKPSGLGGFMPAVILYFVLKNQYLHSTYFIENDSQDIRAKRHARRLTSDILHVA